MRATVAPAWTFAMPDPASMRIRFHLCRSSTHPPRAGAAEPVRLVPRPRTVTGTRRRFARARTAATSSRSLGEMTACGAKAILLLSNEAARVESRSVRTTPGPSLRFSCLVAAEKSMDFNPATRPASPLQDLREEPPDVQPENVRALAGGEPRGRDLLQEQRESRLP